jgi:hypothetical protein
MMVVIQIQPEKMKAKAIMYSIPRFQLVRVKKTWTVVQLNVLQSRSTAEFYKNVPIFTKASTKITLNISQHVGKMAILGKQSKMSCAQRIASLIFFQIS